MRPFRFSFLLQKKKKKDVAHPPEGLVYRDASAAANKVAPVKSLRQAMLQIVLAGQPELDRKLDQPNLRQLKQRIVLRCMLRPFNIHETAEYINSRLEKAGMPNQTVFRDELIREIHIRSQGRSNTRIAIRADGNTRSRWGNTHLLHHTPGKACSVSITYTSCWMRSVV